MKINARAVLVMPWLVLVALTLRDGPFRAFYRSPAGLVVVLVGALLSAARLVVDQPSRARPRGATRLRRPAPDRGRRRDRSRRRVRARSPPASPPSAPLRSSCRRPAGSRRGCVPTRSTARARLGRGRRRQRRSPVARGSTSTVARLFGPPGLAALRRLGTILERRSDASLGVAAPPGRLRRRDPGRVPHADGDAGARVRRRGRRARRARVPSPRSAAVGLTLCGVVFGASRLRGRLERGIADRRERIRLELYTVNQLLAMHVRTGAGPVQATQRIVDRGRGRGRRRAARGARGHAQRRPRARRVPARRRRHARARRRAHLQAVRRRGRTRRRPRRRPARAERGPARRASGGDPHRPRRSVAPPCSCPRSRCWRR